MGEESGVNLFVEQFYHAMLAEPALRSLLNVSTLDALKAEQKDFVAIILGGRPPLDYWDIITSDPPPYLTLEHTDLMIEYAEAVLLNMGIDEAAVKNIIRVLSPFIEAFICGSTTADAGPSSVPGTPAGSPASIGVEQSEEITQLQPAADDEAAKGNSEEISAADAVDPAEEEVREESVAAISSSDPGEISPEEIREENKVEEEETASPQPADSLPAQMADEAENARRFRELIEEKLYRKIHAPMPPGDEGEFMTSEIPAQDAAGSAEDPLDSHDVPPDSNESSPSRATAERLLSSLNLLLSELEEASNGDLTREISLTGDDLIGRLGTSVQELISGVRRSMSRLVELAGDISRISDSLTQIMLEPEDSCRATSVSDDGSLMSAKEEINTASALSAAILHSLRSFLLETGQTAEERADSGKEASEPLHALISHNDEFQYLIRSLREMTSRGATLALNAALEAARAGNDGKCFAVIASEMKDLARGSEQLALNMSRNFKACRYYAHETLSAVRKGVHHQTLSLPPGLESDLNALGESLTRLDAGVNNVRQKSMLAATRDPQGDGRYSEKMFELGKKVGELKLILSKYVV